MSSFLKQYISAVLTAIVFFTIGITIWKLLAYCDCRPNVASPYLWVALFLSIAYRVVNARGWAWVLSAMGTPVDPNAATSIWLHAESRRWLPGGVWGYASRTVQAKRLGISTSVASASMIGELLLTIAAASALSIPFIVCYWPQLSHELTEYLGHVPILLTIAAAVALLAMVAWFMRGFVYKKIATLQERLVRLKQFDLSAKGVFAAFGYYLVMAILNGGITAIAYCSFGHDTPVPLLAIVAATSLAWVVGLLAVFSPGGILVREACLATLLSPWIPYPVGFGLAIATRILQLAAEIICMKGNEIVGRGSSTTNVPIESKNHQNPQLQLQQ